LSWPAGTEAGALDLPDRDLRHWRAGVCIGVDGAVEDSSQQQPRHQTYRASVILADGSAAEIRTVQPGDRAQVLALHEHASDLSLYLRFFSLSRAHASSYAEQVCLAKEGSWSLVVVRNRLVLGVATAVQTEPGAAEVAVMVDETLHSVGIGTLLVEHLAVWCNRGGIHRFVADVLIENTTMIRVFHDAGFEYLEQMSAGVMSLSLDLAQTPGFLSATAGRQRVAQARSMAHLLEPESVAVVGVSGALGGIGRAVVDNVLAHGFAGAVHAVGRNLGGQDSFTRAGDNLHIHRSVEELPEGVDLAVVAVPAPHVCEAVAGLARRGARVCVVLTAGLAESGPEGRALQEEVARQAREHGMRLVGPNCLGVLSNLRRTRLDATFGRACPVPGRLAIASQSGGVGVALLEATAGRGTGVACFVSTGNKADVSSNDLLMAWTDDPAVGVAALYLESFKDPQRFARVASTFSARKPLLAVFGGRSEPGQRGGSSHTAAGATPRRALKALFSAAGVVEAAGLHDLVDTARLLSEQPLPGGRRLGVVVNAGGIGILASDAAQDVDLVVPVLGKATQETLRTLGDGVAGTDNPVDLGAAASPASYADAVRAVLSDEEVHAVLVVAVGTSVTDVDGLARAIRSAVVDANATQEPKPVLVVMIGAPEAPGGPEGGTYFDSIDGAVRALAHAADYVDWRAGRSTVADPRLAVPIPPPEVVPRQLAGSGVQSWMTYDDVEHLLAAYAIPCVPGAVAHTAQEAISEARRVGYPVVVKSADPEIVHKSNRRLVRTGLRTTAALRAAVRELHAITGRHAPLLVQQSAAGVEIAVGAFRDKRFGPLVMVASGGVVVDLWDDQVFLMPPLGDDEVRAALSRLRTWPLLTGFRGAPPGDVDALVDLIRRVGDLATARPDLLEIDLNPVMVAPDGVCCVDAKVRAGTS
jgi:acyl-CoA synthetase (NDP forming)/RimJ/RimL family protein N-acetyltransferase